MPRDICPPKDSIPVQRPEGSFVEHPHLNHVYFKIILLKIIRVLGISFRQLLLIHHIIFNKIGAQHTVYIAFYKTRQVTKIIRPRCKGMFSLLPQVLSGRTNCTEERRCSPWKVDFSDFTNAATFPFFLSLLRLLDFPDEAETPMTGWM